MLEISLCVKLRDILCKLAHFHHLSLVIFEIPPLLDSTTKLSEVAGACSKRSWDPAEPQHQEMEKIFSESLPSCNTNSGVGVQDPPAGLNSAPLRRAPHDKISPELRTSYNQRHILKQHAKKKNLSLTTGKGKCHKEG